MTDDLAFCLDLLRRSDRDRYLAALAAPASWRADLVALYALNAELARIAPAVREPLLGQIRLAWWREAVADFASGRKAPHAVLNALLPAVEAGWLPIAGLHGLIEARDRDLDPAPFASLAEMEAYAVATSAKLICLAAGRSGAIAAPIRETLEHFGIAYALSGLLRAAPHLARERRQVLPLDMLQEEGADPALLGQGRADAALARVVARIASRALWHYRAAKAGRLPRALLPPVLPAALVPTRLERLRAGGYDLFRDPVTADGRDLLRLLRARVKGSP